MSNPYHSDLTDAELHVPGYIQDADPGAVGAGKLWFAPATGLLKIRNAADSAWLSVTPAPHMHVPGELIGPADILDKRIGQWAVENNTGFQYGLHASALTTSGSGASVATDAEGNWTGWQNPLALSGSPSGVASNTSFHRTERRHNPISMVVARISDPSSTRFWVGYGAATHTADQPAATILALFRGNTSTFANFRALSSDGAGNYEETDTGVPYTATKHKFRIDMTATDVLFYIDGLLVAAHATAIPGLTDNINFGAWQVVYGSVFRQVQAQRFVFIQDI